MQNDFEKHISQRLQDFSLTPPPEIWQQVEAALPPEKKRRRIIFWWWLPLLGLLAGGVWLLIRPGQSQFSPTLSPASATSSPSSTAQSNEIANPTFPDSVNNEPVTSTPDPHTTPLSSTSYKPSSNTINPSVTVAKSGPSSASFPPPHQQPLLQQAKQGATLILPFISEQSSSKRLSSDSNTPLHSGTITNPNDSLPANFDSAVPRLAAVYPKENDTTATPDNSATSGLQLRDTAHPAAADTIIAKQIAIKKPAAKSGYWMADGSFGISGLVRPTLGTNTTARYADNYYSAPNTSTGSPAFPSIPRAFALPQTSFSFHLGITRKQTLSRHWLGQVALRYQLLSNLQRYGTLLSSGSSGQNFSSRSDYRTYSTGNNQTYHSYVHQLQLAPQLGYIINPAAASPVSVHAGGSIAYNVATYQLLHDFRSRTYLSSPAYATRWLMAAEVGLGVFIRKKVYTGLLYQHGLSNIARPELQSDFRWRIIQLQIGLPLFHPSSK